MARVNRWLCVVVVAGLIGIVAVTNLVDAKQAPAAAASVGGELPKVVDFTNGANRFLEGDDITITEVRGTADTIAPGNIYCVKGTYKLASHPKAMLAAYITATKASEGKSESLSVQHANVDRGTGEFTLYLPMYIEGWPHVSFYADGEGCGGRYFGTGKYVLEKMWGESQAKADTTESLRAELRRLQMRIEALENRTK